MFQDIQNQVTAHAQVLKLVVNIVDLSTFIK